MSPVDDFICSRLDQMIDLRHALAALTSCMPWQAIEASLAHQFSRQVKAGKKVEDVGLFGPEVEVVGGGRSNAGRLRLPIRLLSLGGLFARKPPANPLDGFTSGRLCQPVGDVR
jgi:hypothetical protein